MAERVSLVPSAHRLMESLRDVGYEVPTSIADLVDNSIEAGATEVWIDFYYKEDESCVRIADNGCGMSSKEIDEALRYGSRRSYGNTDLGKFGLGLKTASLSHCRKLTVASRRRNEKIPSIIMWDLEHVGKTDQWEAIKLREDEANPVVLEWLKKTPGTVVIWEKLDRVLIGKRAQKERFMNLCRQVEEHLSMVFHRFLSGEAKRKLPLSIFINGNKINPWDPFVKNEPETRILGQHELKFMQNGQEVTVLVQPYILPHESMFSSKSAHAAAAGPNKWNRQQGFYIYRNDRLIQSGGWNRLRAADEHTKLARIAIDFDSSADESFQINIAKMRVQIPSAIRKELQEIASSVASLANTIYREKGMSSTKQDNITKKHNNTTKVINSPTSENNKPVKKDLVENVSINRPTIAKVTNVVSSIETRKAKVQLVDETKNAYEAPRTEIVETDRKRIESSQEDLAKMVVSILNQELVDHPNLLDKILNKLASVSTAFKKMQEE